MKDRKSREHLPRHDDLWDELHAEAVQVVRCIAYLLCMLALAAFGLLLFVALSLG